MHFHHLQHLARTVGALLGSSQVIVTGLAGAMKTLASPSTALKTQFDNLALADFLIYDNEHTEGCIDLIESAIGERSPFFLHYGYGARAQAAYSLNLPPLWQDRLVYLNSSLRFCPHILALSPTDLLLDRLLRENDLLLGHELLAEERVSIDALTSLFGSWDLSSAERWTVQTGVAKLINQMNLEGVDDNPGALFDAESSGTTATVSFSNVLSIFPNRRAI